MRVITVTPNPAVDTVTAVDNVVPDRKLRCDAPTRYPGGGGLNVARALLELGTPSTAVWTRGGDMGKLLAGLLDSAGVENLAVPISGETRESFLVRDKSSGAFYRFGLPGPTMTDAESSSVVDAVMQIDVWPEILVASGSLPQGRASQIYGRLAALAKENGCRVVLDADGDSVRRTLKQAPVYLIKPNFREFGTLVGSESRDPEQITVKARELIDDGLVEVVVVTLGDVGSLLVTRQDHVLVRAPRVKVVSPIGAGDSMSAGLVRSLLAGEPLAEAVRWGVAAAAAAMMTPGTELCRREDVERLEREMRHLVQR